MSRLLILIAAGLAAACATPASSRVDKAAAEKLAGFERTGETETCLNVTRINSIDAVDESTLLVRVGASEYYVSDLSGRCSGATNSFNRIQYTTSISQLCRNEILQIVDNSQGFTVGSCGMGSFEKLRKKSDAEPSAE